MSGASEDQLAMLSLHQVSGTYPSQLWKWNHHVTYIVRRARSSQFLDLCNELCNKTEHDMLLIHVTSVDKCINVSETFFSLDNPGSVFIYTAVNVLFSVMFRWLSAIFIRQKLLLDGDTR